MRFPLFDAFDLPDLHQSCGVRSSTVTAPQALLMLNSDLTQQASRRWAGDLLDAHGDQVETLIGLAYCQAFGREASEYEKSSAVDLITMQAATIRAASKSQEASTSPRLSAVTDFCHALLNANEFIYVD